MDEIILKERATKEALVLLLNDSELPAFVLKSMMKEVIEQLDILGQQQYTIAYQSKQEEEAKEND